MEIKIKKLSARLLVALLTFIVGVAAALLWFVPQFRTVNNPSALKVSNTLKDEEIPLPEGWKKLEVKNNVTLLLPQDMKPGEPIGDSRDYREVYNNRDINITIVYGNTVQCDTAPYLLERPTYQESVIDINGRKAKLGIDRYYQSEFIIARLCFSNVDKNAMQLGAVAYCKDDRALETAQQIFTSVRFKDNR